MERHCQNTLAVAQWLEARDEVEWVAYPGLPVEPVARPREAIPAPTARVRSSRSASRAGSTAGRKFIDSLELISHLANVGDVRSLAIHPASTTHQQLTPEEQASAGVTPDLVRLSVGIESIDDITADLDAGFRAAKGA